MKTKIILFIIISILFTGCSPSQASTSSEQSEQSAPQSNSSAENRQLSQAQFEEIFDFYCEEQLTDFDGIEVIQKRYAEEFSIAGEIQDGQLSYQYIPDNGEQQLFGKLDLRQNMIDIYYSESKEMDQYLQEVANGECQLYPTLIEKGGQKAYLMKWLQIG